MRAPTAHEGHHAGLLRLQRLAGNQAVSELLRRAQVQRCGSAPCDCGCRDADETARPAPAVQRVATEFQVRGKYSRSASEPRSIFFDYDSDAIDATEDAKLTALTGTPLATIELKGMVSEEGGRGPEQASLADARTAAVAARLRVISPGTGSPTRRRDLASGSGNLDYRSARKVEVLVSGAPSTTPDCSHGADIDCGPAPNPFTIGHAQAGTLLTAALSALAAPTVAPAVDALNELFHGPANAGAVVAGLTAIQSHLPNMLPSIPLNDRGAPGHRCINTCEGDVLAYNSGGGTSARMTVGPRYLASGDPVEQGLVLIHEGSHAADGLRTKDHAYRWQRLLRLLSLPEARDNADSYALLVALIHDPTAAPPTPHDSTDPGISGSREDAAKRSLAWLEQYLVQGRLEVRTLFSAIDEARRTHGWRKLWYRDNTMADAAPLFGLTAPPHIPSAESQWRIAGIYDRLLKLRVAITGQGIHFAPGPATSWDAGPGPNITLAAGFFGLSPADQVDALLVKAVAAAPFIESGQKSSYVGLVRQMSSRRGGP